MKRHITLSKKLEKINILSELYDELGDQRFESDEEIHIAKLKMSYIKEQILKLSFEVKKIIQVVEESHILN
jgi:predicted transcriptional regulator